MGGFITLTCVDGTDQWQQRFQVSKIITYRDHWSTKIGGHLIVDGGISFSTVETAQQIDRAIMVSRGMAV